MSTETNDLALALPEAPAARRLQFARRAILLFVAYGLALMLLTMLRGGLASAPLEPLRTDVLGSATASTMALLVVGFMLALAQAAVVTVIAVGIHNLEKRSGQAGSVLKGLGRLWVFAQAAAPAFVLALMLIFIVRGQIRVVGNLLLPAVLLALLPTVLAAQAAARETTLLQDRGFARARLAGALTGLGALFGQTGGMLSAVMVLETIFARPGLARLMVSAFMQLEVDILFYGLATFTTLVLMGRLLAELFRWLARLARPPLAEAGPEMAPVSTRPNSRRVWVGVSLALLLLPGGMALAGLAVNAEAALSTSITDRNAPPSAGHLLGTDSLGRDVLARLLRGVSIAVGMALVAGIIAASLSLPAGGLAGWLASRRTLPRESLADLVLLPAEALSLIPALPLAIVLVWLTGPPSAWVLAAFAGLVLAPRGAHAFQALWLARPAEPGRSRSRLLAVAALFLALFFAAVGLISSMDFLGLGVRPPTATLGAMLADSLQTFRLTAAGLVTPGVALWLCTFAFFMTADALIGFFDTKEPMSRLNE